MMKAVPQVPRMKMSRDDDLAEVETMELAHAEAAIAAMPEPANTDRELWNQYAELSAKDADMAEQVRAKHLSRK
jgi:hypothetical protein